MIWIIRLLSKAKKFDTTDVMNQQMGSDLINLLKELIS